MLFNSYIFILFFLPLALALYFGLNKLGKEKVAMVFLIGMSLWFYAYFQVSYLWILVGSVLFNYLFSKLVYAKKTEKYHKLFLGIGVIANVGLIFYFKYYNFFLENVNAVFGTSMTLLKIVMPLGISFFTFQQISYLVDSYRGETKDYSFLEYALFVVFFPQLIAGPIVLHDEMVPQFRDSKKKNFHHEDFAKGLWWFAIGLGKKVLLADTLGRGVDWGYSNVGILGALDTALVALVYALQLYFDFSGYCDMASGLAAMFRFELPLNFDSPYKALSIADFWNRWHASLGRFLRKYVYFPLGGSRKGKARANLNLFLVFFVSGVWHGASWTYILWGMMNGIARVLYSIFANIWDRVPKWIRCLSTFSFFAGSLIMFRSANVGQALEMYGNLLQPWNLQVSLDFLHQFDVLEFTYIEEHVGFLGSFIEAFPAMHALIVTGAALFMAWVPANCHEKEFVPTLPKALGTIVLLVWSIVSLSGLSSFLYFNF